ncbi:Rhomboid-like protein 19 [Sesamum angolense]|uniref:Rhomboid-like protein 19 n=1 Tax=Sesamum angolense TaxID=2727404 RepID=A0AAE1W352_9LAMI|nr:Rhomboid-like protein 19 [Sesamum angolense]
MSSPQPSGGTMSIYTGFTRLCKGLAVGGGGQIMPPAVSYLALIPAKTIPFAWNLITAGYIEQSIIGVVISSSLRFHHCYFLVLRYKAGTVPLSAYFWFPRVLSGFLVGIKQIIPDQELSLLRIKAKWLPTLALLVSVVVSFFTTESASYLPTIIFGTYIGWIYLRYWQRKPETKLRGDPSDEFAFSTFFPEFLRRIIDPVATIFERMFCGRRSENPDQTRGYTLGGASLPGSDSIDASRRRERGARALEERLAERLAAAAARTDETRRDASENV